MPPISTIGLGRALVSSLNRVPNPPASITAFIIIILRRDFRRLRALNAFLFEIAPTDGSFHKSAGISLATSAASNPDLVLFLAKDYIPRT